MNTYCPKNDARRISSPLAGLRLLVALLGALAFGIPNLHAQEVALPNDGRQALTLGLSLNPGVLHDPDAADALTGAGMGQVGLTQIINAHFFMSAEAHAGVQWMRPHTAAKDGAAPGASHFAWQIGVYAHWLPFAQAHGWVVNAGIHHFQVHLDDAPLQVMGGEVRLGRYLWSDDERFLLVQVGYSLPIIQGLSRPDEFDPDDAWADENWSFHRFSLGFSYGF